MPVTASDIANCPIGRRGNWLFKAFYLTEAAFGAVLFPYLVSEYKRAPSKSKALFIYDKCVFQSAAVHQVVPTTLDLHGVVDTARMSPASVTLIEAARAQRELALSMSWFKRVATSGERKADVVAGPGVFDELLAQHLAPPKGDNPWNDILPVIETAASPRATSLYVSMKKRFPKTAEEIKAAGFDLDKIGISYITLIFKG
jgi:hypothetical protein